MKNESQVVDISMDLVKPDPNQPRKDFGEGKNLVHSMKELGQINPIHITKLEDDNFLILDGESRYSAAEILKWKTIQCIIIDIDDERRRDIQFAANFMRSNFNPFELADEFHRMMGEHDLSQVKLAEKLGKSESTISSILKIRELPEEIKKRLIPVSRKAGKEALILVSRADSHEAMDTMTDLILNGAPVAKLRKALKDEKQDDKIVKSNPTNDNEHESSDEHKVQVNMEHEASCEENQIIKAWWDTFSIYAIRTTDLLGILPTGIQMNQATLGKWIDERVGTIILGYCIVSVSIAPGKIVHQLIPNEEYRRTSYEKDLTIRSKENRVKATRKN